MTFKNQNGLRAVTGLPLDFGKFRRMSYSLPIGSPYNNPSTMNVMPHSEDLRVSPIQNQSFTE